VAERMRVSGATFSEAARTGPPIYLSGQATDVLAAQQSAAALAAVEGREHG
jgi:hypothetical protein